MNDRLASFEVDNWRLPTVSIGTMSLLHLGTISTLNKYTSSKSSRTPIGASPFINLERWSARLFWLQQWNQTPIVLRTIAQFYPCCKVYWLDTKVPNGWWRIQTFWIIGNVYTFWRHRLFPILLVLWLCNSSPHCWVFYSRTTPKNPCYTHSIELICIQLQN